MRVSRLGRAATVSCLARRAGWGLAALCAVLIGGTTGTQDAVANGDTRSLTLYHTHTKERATITFRRNGRYDPRGLEQLNWILRDWRHDEPTRMDPRLFDTLWEVYRQVGSREAIHITSAYRSPKTNAMLRRRSSAVAKNSQHMLGKAMDFSLPDVPIDKIRAVGMRLQHGGVGYYPSAYTPFIHLDVGSVRAWPRMTRDQLVRLFPDGKTVHIPADGRPLPGYEMARAEVLSAGWSVGGYRAVADAGETAPAPARKSFWATLFGGNDDDEDAEEIRASRTRQAYVPRRAPPVNIYSDSSSSVYAALQQPAAIERQPMRAAPQPVVVQARPEPEPLAPAPVPPRQEPPPPAAPRTRIAGLPNTVQTPSGPKLVWQQGAQAQDLSVPSKSGPEGAREMAFAPLPPRRPEEVVATGALAFAPMPPTRPGSLAATNPIPIGASELRGTTVVSAQMVEHPLPPPRPVARPVEVASLGTAAMAALVAQPAETPKVSQPPPRASAPQAPAAARLPTRPKAAPSSSGSLVTAASVGLNLGFSTQPMGDLSPNRFTGPAVKPLPILR